MAWQGKERKGKARQGKAMLGRAGQGGGGGRRLVGRSEDVVDDDDDDDDDEDYNDVGGGGGYNLATLLRGSSGGGLKAVVRGATVQGGSDGRDVVGGGCTPLSARVPATNDQPWSIHGGFIRQVERNTNNVFTCFYANAIFD
uniref:Uncharacterized protein n=1 Tax=Vespula pensylvanica TaxID=30213 RepID=A0A834P171_VESPE|nr:hypothetical protein H0235_009104 [Vespula pensylvanica]